MQNKKMIIKPINAVRKYNIRLWIRNKEESTRSILFSLFILVLLSKFSELITILNRVNDRKSDKKAKL